MVVSGNREQELAERGRGDDEICSSSSSGSSARWGRGGIRGVQLGAPTQGVTEEWTATDVVYVPVSDLYRLMLCWVFCITVLYRSRSW